MSIPNIITIIISLSALVVSIISSFITKQMANAENINSCNERYCKVMNEVTNAMIKNDKKDFESSIYALLDVFCHQFILWQLKLLPNNIFKIWAKYNHHQIELLYITTATSKYTFQDVWNEVIQKRKFKLEGFVTYMESVISGDSRKIDHLKRSRNIEY